MKTFREFISELTQSDLNREFSTINQNTRNAPIKRSQPTFQSSQSEPQRPNGVPIPGTPRLVNLAKTAAQGVVNKVLN